jgi:hypothetical protein
MCLNSWEAMMYGRVWHEVCSQYIVAAEGIIGDGWHI